MSIPFAGKCLHQQSHQVNKLLPDGRAATVCEDCGATLHIEGRGPQAGRMDKASNHAPARAESVTTQTEEEA